MQLKKCLFIGIGYQIFELIQITKIRCNYYHTTHWGIFQHIQFLTSDKISKKKPSFFRRTKVPKFRAVAENVIRRKILSAEMLPDYQAVNIQDGHTPSPFVYFHPFESDPTWWYTDLIFIYLIVWTGLNNVPTWTTTFEMLGWSLRDQTLRLCYTHVTINESENEVKMKTTSYIFHRNISKSLAGTYPKRCKLTNFRIENNKFSMCRT